MSKLSVVISHCTHDARFLDLCIEEVQKIADEIIVCTSDHFFNGEKEKRELLNRAYIDHPKVQFIEFAFGDELYGLYPNVEEDKLTNYWHSTSRYIGTVYSSGDYLLYLDVDEIIDGERFKKWLENFPYQKNAAHRIWAEFYFREPIYRAKGVAHSILLVKRDAIPEELILSPYERNGMFAEVIGGKWSRIVGLDGQPLIHHYSWVRTKQELLLKTRRWGHRKDKDWHNLIEKEFEAPFSGTENLFGLSYDIVEMKHNPLAVEIIPYSGAGPFPNVIYTTPQEVRKLSFFKI